jgi:integrase
VTFQSDELQRLRDYAAEQWHLAGHVLPYELAGETLHESIRGTAIDYFARHGIKWWTSRWDLRSQAFEFQRLLDAAGSPQRRRPGLAERDQLVLLTLVSTGLRRSELLALNWGDLHLDSARPSLLVRRGKGRKSRRQPLPPVLCNELTRLRTVIAPNADAPVFRGLGGKRLTSTILASIIRRAAERAGLEKRVSAHTLRHTAATWLRQQTGDARLVAAFLGHADLSTVSRYAHVASDELHAAASAVADKLQRPESVHLV